MPSIISIGSTRELKVVSVFVPTQRIGGNRFIVYPPLNAFVNAGTSQVR